MRNLRRIYKLCRLCVHAIIGMGLTLVLTRSDETLPTPRFDKVACWWRERIGHILGLKIRVTGKPVHGSAVWMANHISWIDIVVLGGYPISFLSKADVRTWPVIGWLAARGGTLFMRRFSNHGARTAADSVSTYLVNGRTIVIFPEGTTTKGDRVLPFHPGLFSPAIKTGTPIQPVALVYYHKDKTGHAERHLQAPYVDNDGLLTHLWRILGEVAIEVELAFLPAFPTRPDMDRKQLAAATHDVVSRQVMGETASHPPMFAGGRA